MSKTYSDLTFSQFPDDIDSYEYMQDLTSDLIDLVSQYESLINSRKFSDAAQLLTNNPSLNRIYFNAEKYNKLIDSIRATQRLYSTDVRKYILELMSFKGEYINSQKYIRYNVVSYNSMIYLCILDCPLGTLPTDTTYWYPLSIKGEKGVGIGLSYDGLWQANFTYNKDSAISYGTCLYASTCDDNVGHTPSQSSSYWISIIDFTDLITYDNSSSGLSSTNFQDAINELNLYINNNKNSINNNTNSINTINTKLNTIEQGAQKNTVTGIKGSSETLYRTGNVNITKANIGLGNVDNVADSNKSVKYATSAGSATNAQNASNSDTVDGFHFQISTNDLVAGSSSLTTNVFYFVYE
jgi:hypothetical protein